MGGNAIKTVPTRRFTKAEYEALAGEVKEKFDKDFEFSKQRWHIIDSYREKESFGDMDVLVSRPPNATWKWNSTAFTTLFPSKEVVPNGDVVSLEYNEFQMDFIQVPYETFEFAKVYFAFNDLGNLIGKTARQLGLKYGHQGLIYTIRDGLGDKVGEIPVTLDPKEALEFLGYDWTRYQQGFKNLEEIFQYAVSSRYFNADRYLLENLNHVDRIRDRKRATYTAFLDWIKNKDLPRDEERLPSNWFVPEIREAFPSFSIAYDLKNAKLEKAAAAKIVFNGNLVSDLTKRTGKDLGEFMMKFRAQFKSEDDMFDYLSYAVPINLDRVLLAFHRQLST